MINPDSGIFRVARKLNLNFRIFAPFKQWLMSFNSINPAHAFLKNYCNGEVIDVGANIGNYSSYFLKNGARVHAFEPTPETFKLLKSKLKNKNVVCYNVLVGNSIGKTKFYFSGTSGENSAIPQKELTHEIELYQTKLDEYNFVNVSLIKIDVQAMDFEVLLGAVKTLEKHKPSILIECWEEGLKARGYSVKHINDFMAACGYMGEKVYDCGNYHDMFFRPIKK